MRVHCCESFIICYLNIFDKPVRYNFFTIHNCLARFLPEFHLRSKFFTFNPSILYYNLFFFSKILEKEVSIKKILNDRFEYLCDIIKIGNFRHNLRIATLTLITIITKWKIRAPRFWIGWGRWISLKVNSNPYSVDFNDSYFNLILNLRIRSRWPCRRIPRR